MSEEWKDIPEYEGIYQISSFGRIRRVQAGRGAVEGRTLKLTPNSQGYLRVQLRHNPHSIHNHYVHVLVAAAFLGPKPPGMDVNHKNGNKADNWVNNLEYLTRHDNIIHAFRVLGTDHNRGEKNPRAILTKEQVRTIRHMYKTGEYTQTRLGEMFGVHRSTIKNVVARLQWTHV